MAREAIQRIHPGGPKGPRRWETQTPAPIEVRWGKVPQGWPLGNEVGVPGDTLDREAPGRGRVWGTPED